MRKNVTFGLLLMIALFSVSVTSYAQKSTWKSLLVNAASIIGERSSIPTDAKSITVYLIVGEKNAAVPKSAHYSPSTNRIYVQEGRFVLDYNVYENPHYGQDSAKGRFKYRAGDYFFDL